LAIWLLPTATLTPIRPLLAKELAARGLAAEITVTGYGELDNELLRSNSKYHVARPETTILLPDAHDLLAPIMDAPFSTGPAAREALVAQAVARVATAAARAAAVSREVFLTNGAWPPQTALGLLETSPALSVGLAVAEFNRRIAEIPAQHPTVVLLDYCGLVAEAGYARFHDARLWAHARMRLSAEGLLRLAKLLARAVAAARRRPRKCIVLDLDDTLWGGILGEAGIEGIRVGPEGVGLAFALFQRELLEIRARGILLAIASKNDEAHAWEAIARHPGMVLRREHVAAARIGWQPKTVSLREIAAELGFDLDALVLVDDSPHERELVRQQLPAVAVVDLPDDPADFVPALRRCEELDTLRLTSEDQRRSQMAAEQSRRAALREQSDDLASYLRSLEQRATVEDLDENNLPRAAQLCQRTNQFNLTLRRHDAAALADIRKGEHAGIVVRVCDRLGDSGQVGFALALPAPDAPGDWVLDTLVLSCRVIGRDVETVLLAELARAVQSKGGRRLQGQYVPGPRNEPCAQLLPRHGFRPQAGSSALWLDLVAQPIAQPATIQVIHEKRA
jgi:FkbH-like protein